MRWWWGVEIEKRRRKSWAIGQTLENPCFWCAKYWMVDDALINTRATIDLRLWFCVVYFSALTESLRLPLSLAPTFFYRLRWSTISLINHHHQRYSHSKRHRLSIDSVYRRFAYSITRFNIKKVSRQSSYGNFFSIMDVWKLRHATVPLEN